MHSIALIVTLVLTSTPGELVLLTRGFIPDPSEAQLRSFTIVYWAGLAVVALAGVGWLLGLWRSTRRPGRVPPAFRVPTGSPPR